MATRGRLGRPALVVLIGAALALAATAVMPRSVDAEADASDVVFADGVLTLTGDDEFDRFEVRCEGNGAITVAISAAGGRLEVQVGSCAGLTRIVAIGGEGVNIFDFSGLPADAGGGQGPIEIVATGGGSADKMTPAADHINVFDGGDGGDSLLGGNLDDTLDAGGDGDKVDGAGGDDLVDGGAGSDNVAGGAGRDRVKGSGDGDQLYGDTGNDSLLGGDSSDKLDGGPGGDRLSGGGASDKLLGGPGVDRLSGGGASDKLIGGPGGDRMSGGGASDKLIGGAGGDLLLGGGAIDKLIGGPGSNTEKQ